MVVVIATYKKNQQTILSLEHDHAYGGNYLRVTGSNIVLNDPGASYDVRIEGDTDTNLFFADGSADKVGIGENSPISKLHVQDANDISMVLLVQDKCQ